VTDLPPFWQLTNFTENLQTLRPSPEMSPQRLHATLAWIRRVEDNPFRPEMSRQADMRHDELGDLYFGPVPGTRNADNSWVVCSYWINEYMRTVRCDGLGILTNP
jgi:hypothetical protein